MSRQGPRFPPAFSGLFDRHYPLLIRGGLLLGLAFATLAHGAHDLWTSSVLFVLLSFLTLILLVGHYRTKRSFHTTFLFPLGALLCAMTVSLRFSYNVPEGLHEVWIWYYVFTVFLLILHARQSGASDTTFLQHGALLLIPLAGIALYDQFFNPASNDGFVNLLGYPLRYRRGDIHATLLNSIVMTGFTLSWVFVAWEDRKNSLRGPLVLGAAILLLVLGQSWASIFALLAGSTIFLKDSFEKPSSKRLVFLLVGLALVIVLLLKVTHSGSSSTTVMNRLYWWWSTLQMAFERPFTGVGPGAFATAFPWFRELGSFGTLFAHSFPLQVLSELGIMGLGLFIYLAILMVREVHEQSTPNRILQASVVTILAYAVINFNLDYFINRFTLALILGLLVPLRGHTLMIRSRKTLGLWLVWVIGVSVISLQPWRVSHLYTSISQDLETTGNWSSAREGYARVLSLDHTYSDAYKGLAQCSWHDYTVSKNPSDLAFVRYYLTEAIRWKKDIATVEWLRHLSH